MRAAHFALVALVTGSLLAAYAIPRHAAVDSPAEEAREATLLRAKLSPSGGISPMSNGAGGATSTKPIVTWAVARGQSKPFAQLAPGVPTFKDLGELEEHELGRVRAPQARAPGLRDPVLQAAQPAASAPAPIATFEGISQPEACAGCIPPDTTGAVGRKQYVQMVNEHLAVFDKATGLLVGSIRGINTLFADLPGSGKNCRTENNGDPVVIYDQLADRWMVSQFAVPGGADGYHECIAVSKTDDATGGYWIYDFKVGDSVNFHDYPHLGLWPDAYYMSTHVFDPSAARGAGAFAFEREKMLQGLPARQIYFPMYAANASFWGHLPATLDGANPPPAGAPGIFVEVDASGEIDNDNAMRIWRFHADWTNPLASTFGVNSQPNFKLPVAAFSRPLCGVLPQTLAGCVPQPTSWVQLDSLGDRLMYRAAYRNFGDHESLVLNHTVEADSTTMQAGPRWYEVRGLSTNAPTLHQQGTFAPTGQTDLLYRWMGSVAMDHMGNMAIGYSTSSNVNFPSIAYAGRLATDPLGQLTQGETPMFAGGGSQNPYGFVGASLSMIRTGRWGDYSTMTVDPEDDCTFWFTTEYFPSPIVDPVSHVFTEWHTRIGSFKYPNCVNSSGTGNHAPVATLAATPTGGRPPLTVAFAVTASDVDAGDTVSYTLDFGDGTTAATGGAGSAQPVSHAYTTEGVFTAQLTVSDGTTTAISSQVITVANPGSGPTCSVPGVEVVRDNNTFIFVPTDVVPVPADDGLDIGSIWMAEPFEGPSTQRIAISLGVKFAPNELPGGAYYVFFNTADGVKHWVYYDVNSKLSGLGTAFTYGHEEVNPTAGTVNELPDGPADADSAVDTANGRITWYITKSKIGALATSPTLAQVSATSYLHLGVPGLLGGYIQDLDFTDTGSYEQAGNAACAPPPVNHAPVGALMSDKTSGDAPLTVQFTAGGIDADNDTLTLDLDYNDGSAHGTGSGSHTYTAAGTYTAKLTVSDGRGGTDTKTRVITVTTAPVNHAPVATLSPPTATIHEGEAVSFDVGATDEDGDALTVDLNFDDGSAHATQTGVIGHTYTTAGSYTATLIVADGRGGSATKTASITVQPATVGSLAVHLAADKSGGDVSHGPITVTFTATVENDDGTPLQYTFAFGDGETSTVTQAGNVITHDYAYAGTYHPYVTATQKYGSRAATSGDNDATITTTTSVAVSPVLAAKLIYDFPSGNVAPADVVFTTDGSSGEGYTLEFGDGDKQDGTGAPPASITHHYAAPQAYTAKLTVRNSSGSASTSNSQTFTLVAKQQLTALLQVSASEGTSPLEVIVDGCHSIPGNGHRITSFTVNFGDGTDPVTQTVDSAHVVDCSGADRSSDPSVFTHTYTVTSSKTFTPTLTVTDDVAASSFATYSTGVAVAAPAVAAPAASSGGGGGFGWLTLVPMLGAALRRRRGALGAVLGALGLALAGTAHAEGSGTLSETSPPLTYAAGPFFVANETPIPTQTNSATCNGFVFPPVDGQVTPCDHYKLTVDLPSDYAARFPSAVVKVSVSWVDTADATPAAGMGVSDYDLYIFNGDRSTNDGFDTADSSSASGANPEIATFHAKSGSNVYSIFISPYTPSGETLNVKIELVPGASAGTGSGSGATTPVAGPDTDGLGCGTSTVFGGADPVCAPAARFQLFKPDAANENNGQQNGEFNIGYNPKTGNIMAMSVTFPGKVFAVTPPEVATAGAPESGESTWADRSSLWESLPAVVGDPILWTDQETGRTFEANLIYGPNVSYAFSDDDGKTWTNAGISGVMGFDHETIGSGPYPAGSPFEAIAKARGYVGKDGKGRQVYYCSQDNPAVYPNGLPSGIPGSKTLNTCVRSDDGGLTWSPVQIAGDGTVCGFIHGHLHIAPDGTAYLPNSHCDAHQGGFYTSDAGLTWSPFLVPASVGLDSGSDPSIAIDDANKLYYCYVNADGRAHVQVGKRNADNSLTWGKDTDIGASHGILNANFVEAVGGDANRAACGFLGTDMPGNAQSLDFPGVWYVYVAYTFDGGDTWTTVNATPNDPVQGAGGIWLQGGTVANRNLLDFNEITADDKGRVIYGFDDGCLSADCIADPTYDAPGHSSKEFQAKMRVLRQTGGKTLRAAYDGQFAPLRAPGRPSLSGTPSAGGLVLKWTVPDHGGSAITGYTVRRTPTGATGTAKTFAVTNKTTLTDTENVSGNGYAYRVTATNAAGTGQASNAFGETVVTPPESACTFPGVKIADDPAGPEAAAALAIPQAGTPSQLDMRAIHVSEVYTSPSDKTLTFAIDVSDLSSIPPSSSWSVQWTQPDTTGTSRTLWVQADNTANTPPDTTLHGNIAFNDTGGTTSQCGTTGPCPVTVAVDTANKRLLLKLDTSNPLSFTSLGTGTTFSAVVGKGAVLTGLHGITQMYLGVPGVAGATPTIDQTTGANYTVVGNASCKPNTPPVATLAASTRSGPAPLTVTFTVGATDPDAGDTVTYDLSFGDGAHATGTGSGTVSHTYAEGTWSASLTVTDNHGESSMDGVALQATAAQVNHAPTATLTPPSASIIAGDTVTFTATGADSDAGDTLTYDLNYGDGTAHATTPGQHPHVYTRAGTFTASLQVTDSAGAHDLQVSTITVAANHAPVATLSPPTATIHEGEAVSFNVGATDEDGDALTVDLDFADGSAHGSQTGVVGHTYTTAGRYTATLTVQDGRGGIATKTASVTVQGATIGSLAVHLAADKSGGDVGHGPITVTFTATVENDDGTPLQYTFAFGDGETSTVTQASNVITHDYAYAGTYHPYVTATQAYGSRAATSGDNDATITTTTSVAVSPVLAAKLIYDFPSGNVAPADVVFSTNGSSGDSYTLEFGDGSTQDGAGAPPASITHHYAAPQPYTAKLTVRDASGSASNSQTFTLVAKQQLTALLQVSASEGTSPLEVIVDGCHSIPGNGHRITSFTVNFGDGTDPVTQTVDSAHVVDCSGADRSSDPSVFTHTYTVHSSKTFFPTLTVTDDVAASSFSTYSTGVEVAPPAVAAPAASSGGGGGFGWLTLVPMLGAALGRRRKHFAAVLSALGLGLGFAQGALASSAITLTDGNDVDHALTYSAGPFLVRDAEIGGFFGCIDSFTCDDTPLTINVSSQVAATQRVVVYVSWGAPVQADFDLFIFKGSAADPFASSASTTDPEVARFEPVNGTYTINIDAYQPFGNTVDVKVYLEPIPPTTPPPSGAAARYGVFPPPAAMVSAASGTGEPSIGVNAKTDTTVTGNPSSTFFINWDDQASPAAAAWAERSPVTNFMLSFDPILFTDRDTGLTVVSQLTGDLGIDGVGVIGCSASSISYDDGMTWIPAEGCGPPSGVDHQGIGGGPYHAPIPSLPELPVGAPASILRHAVYYCSQSFGVVLGDATCARSDDGGLTYNPAVVVYTSECGGLHGHPRVSPQGTVYLPNRDCAGTVSLGQGIAYSTDNGLTWKFSIVPGSTPGESDPSVATGLNNSGKPASQATNTVYFGYCDGDGHAKVSISRNEGVTFSEGADVGALAGVRNCVFPEMIAGDDNRATFYFLGTKTGGSYQAADFTGEWHAYVATTYDAGAHWGIFDATPNDPVQIGCVWMQGGSSPCRNMLDFNDIALDSKGRPNWVFTDGCVFPGCKPGDLPSKSRSSMITIGRQSGGKTLFAAFDSDPAIGGRVVPAAPRLIGATTAADGVTVKWSVPDEGDSAISAYRIYRGTAAGSEIFLKEISAAKALFLDTRTTTGTTYFYKVSAVNAQGEGAKFGEVSAAGQTVQNPNTAPVASLTSDVTSGDAPLAVTFTVAGTDADNDTLSYDLDFDDGSTHSTVAGAVSHSYTAVGDHTASLTVTDGKGGTSTKTLLIHVTQPAPVNHAPVATLSPPTATIHEGEAVSFAVGATDEDGDALTVDLDFDDHSTHGTQTGVVGHTYTTAGSYTATLTVSDGRGGVATKTTSVTVQPATVGSLAVHLAADKSGGDVSHGAITVTFTASVENDDGTPIQYTFAFGDGETSTVTQAGNVIAHDYAYAGTYHPYVTATQKYGSRAATSGDNEATITTTSTVTVSPVLAAKLLYDFPSGNVAPADVVFSTDGSSGESYTLEFGDGDKQDGTGAPPASITHHYASPQAFTAKLTVRNSSGSASTSNSQTFTLVAKQQLTALLQVSASEGTSPLEVIIDGCHSIPGNGHRLASFTVNFGDGTDPVTQAVDSAHVVDCSATDRSSDPSRFTHTYTVTSSKTFFPTLTVTDDVAASSFSTYSTGVAVSPPAVEPPAVAPAASGGGGGGFGWLTLLPLFGAGALRRQRGRVAK